MLRLKKIAVWTGRILLVLLLLLSLATLFIYSSTEKRLNKKYSFSEPELAIPSDSGSIRKGMHLYQIRSCGDCHGAKLEGGMFMNDSKLLQLTAPNLTKGKGGLPDNYTSKDWVRVLRHGVDKTGKSLWMMPAYESNPLSKTDLANLIAYCQSVAPVEVKQEKLKKMGPIGRVLMVLDNVAVLPAERINHATPLTGTTPTNKVGFGKYLARTCEGCHRSNLKGGSPLAPGFPAVPDISATGAPGNWSESEFIAAIRTGKTPEGKLLRNEFMPWQNMHHFSDEELTAIKSYLQQLR